MPLIVTEPIKIGEETRLPGYVLTERDMAGRNIGAMKRHGHIKWVDEAPAASGSRRRSRSNSTDGE